MKQHKGLWILVGVVLVAFGFIAHMLFGDTSPITAGDPNGKAVLVDFDGADLREEKDGKILWAVKAERIQYNPKTRDFFLTHMTAEFHDGNRNLVVKAKEATLTENQQVFTMIGDVEASGDGLAFKAENLVYTSKDSKLHTDKPFYLKDGSTILTGDSLTADRVLQVVKAKGHVKLTKEK